MDGTVFFVSVRFVLGSLFLYAGINKLRAHEHFYASLLTFRTLSPWQARVLARILPVIESISGCFLFVGLLGRFMAALITSLLLIFITALLVAWVRKFDVSCNCFGRQQDGEITSIPYALARNLLLGSMALLLVFAPNMTLQVLLTTLQKQIYLEALVITVCVLLLLLLSNMIMNVLRSVRSLRVQRAGNRRG